MKLIQLIGAYPSPNIHNAMYWAYKDFKTTLTKELKEQQKHQGFDRWNILNYADFKLAEFCFNNRYQPSRWTRSTVTFRDHKVSKDE